MGVFQPNKLWQIGATGPRFSTERSRSLHAVWFARQLSSEQVAALVEGYQAGATVYELASRFKIHRVTVSQHLHRQVCGCAASERTALHKRSSRSVRMCQGVRSRYMTYRSLAGIRGWMPELLDRGRRPRVRQPNHVGPRPPGWLRSKLLYIYTGPQTH